MSAILSDDGLFRYTLERPLSALGKGSVLWVMLNPSTADAETDDPTITRCIGYSTAWGYANLMVGNLYAYRATDPAMLWDAAENMDVRGIECEKHLCRMAARANLILVAWGSHADQKRANDIYGLLLGFGSLFCIGKTKAGQPWHPLYKAKGLTPKPYFLARLVTTGGE